MADEKVSMLSRRDSHQSKVELRVEVAEEDIATLDGYCNARGKTRTDVIRELLREWSAMKRPMPRP